MARFPLRLVLAGVLLCSGLAFAQGDFAHFAYGAGYQTTFTFINLSTSDTANASLSFYKSDGSALQADVQGVGPVGPYNFTIPAGGSKTVALAGDPAAAASTEGWAHLDVVGGYPTVRGQGSFRRHLGSLPDFEAVVPLTGANPECVIYFPNSNPQVLVPFDNTAGQYLTALAFANSSAGTQTLQLDYYDESYQKIVSKTLTMNAFAHVAFVTYNPVDPATGSDPALTGKKGVLRIQATSQDFTVLGLLFNTTGPFTAILPILER